MLHRRVSYSCIYEVCMSPALNGSSALHHFESGNMIEIGIMLFDFYPGLSQIL